MDRDRTIHIELQLELHDDEVAGRAVSGRLPPREFVGWLGLIAALDALVAAPAPAPRPWPPRGR